MGKSSIILEVINLANLRTLFILGMCSTTLTSCAAVGPIGVELIEENYAEEQKEKEEQRLAQQAAVESARVERQKTLIKTAFTEALHTYTGLSSKNTTNQTGSFAQESQKERASWSVLNSEDYDQQFYDYILHKYFNTIEESIQVVSLEVDGETAYIALTMTKKPTVEDMNATIQTVYDSLNTPENPYYYYYTVDYAAELQYLEEAFDKAYSSLDMQTWSGIAMMSYDSASESWVLDSINDLNGQSLLFHIDAEGNTT
jgi:hypothetical protein